jgi:SAM-dependent methyltransferase
MGRSRLEPVQYYQQTVSAYLEGLSRAQIDANLNVVEIGSERTHHKLRIIKDLCASAYALNIFFHVPQDSESREFVTRVLGDMSSRLPFSDESLDLVIISASLHHAPNLSKALKEVARVLRHGGRALVLNEPVEGAAKRLGSRLRHDRNALIKEDPITWRMWGDAIAVSGLRADHFLPEWFIGRVRAIDNLSSDTRFYSLAKAMHLLVRVSAFSEILRVFGRIPGQRILGLPLNAVLWKDAINN